MEARAMNGSVREGGVFEDYLTQKGSFTGSLQLSLLWWWSQYEGLLSFSFHCIFLKQNGCKRALQGELEEQKNPS